MNRDSAPREVWLVVKVWDAPIRLFHWALVVLVFMSWLTAHEDWMDWHMRSGYSIFALLLFQFAWGFIGSDTARFSQFVRSPIAALRYLAEFRRRAPDTEIGHNAAFGWMVLVLLSLLALQVATGLLPMIGTHRGSVCRGRRTGHQRLAQSYPRAELQGDRGPRRGACLRGANLCRGQAAQPDRRDDQRQQAVAADAVASTSGESAAGGSHSGRRRRNRGFCRDLLGAYLARNLL